ncbi:hypothetical protein HYDPIDRAFT_170950 [Hydnomerulius pinastri MD-312]|uniref:Uncharacterized protein n=1 Tax=Hydnomerulius pinastri MD-312 TaxID=994086 RepID=A0A0C9W8T1_9AGAM|nr:hypothetical protein HYDPIDRAFT_170950 [Hydnomerulius pinastri MD-312]
MARVKKCSLAQLEQFHRTRGARWRMGEGEENEAPRSDPSQLPGSASRPMDGPNSSLSMPWTTRSHELGVLRVTLREVQNELEVTKVLLAGRTAEVEEKGLALSEKEVTLNHALRATRKLALTITREKHTSMSCLSHHLFNRGKSAYSMQFCSIARSFVLAGCACKEVGSVIQSIVATFGTHHAEISGVQAITISTDSTSHHHIDYTSQHVAMKTPQSAASQKDTGSHVVRLLGVDSSVNHKADMQLEELKAKVNSYTHLYNNLPLSHWTKTHLSSLDVTQKLMGVNGDHSSVKEWKKDNTYLELGQDSLSGPLSSELVEAVANAHEEVLEQAGSLDAWNTLSHTEWSARENAAQECVARQLGKEAFNSLSEEEQHHWTLIELNGMKGGCVGMAACWEESGFERPILLANKDNAATLKGISDTDITDALTAAELRAFEVSGWGGPKTTSIAGAIFNNKDDKKGLQDAHRQYFVVIKGPGESTTFPNTSNVRYQSHCFAAEELITYLDNYIALLIQTRYKKEKHNFSHMEPPTQPIHPCRPRNEREPGCQPRTTITRALLVPTDTTQKHSTDTITLQTLYPQRAPYASGLEHSRHMELNAHAKKVARESQVKEAERLATAAKEKARVDAITLVLDTAMLERLMRAQLDDQLAVHRHCDPTIKAKSNYKNHEAKLTAVKAAVADFLKLSLPQARSGTPSTDLTAYLLSRGPNDTNNNTEESVQYSSSKSDSDSELY